METAPHKGHQCKRSALCRTLQNFSEPWSCCVHGCSSCCVHGCSSCCVHGCSSCCVAQISIELNPSASASGMCCDYRCIPPHPASHPTLCSVQLLRNDGVCSKKQLFLHRHELMFFDIRSIPPLRSNRDVVRSATSARHTVSLTGSGAG